MSEPSVVDYGRLLDVVGIEAELLADVLHAAPGNAPVPTCPGWKLAELGRHVGSVYRMIASWLTHGQAPQEWQRDPRPGQSVDDFLRAGYTQLHHELAVHAPAEYTTTWWPADMSYGFWRRRTAHETTIHRVDAQMASGLDPATIADDVALDGIDEVLALWFGHRLPMIGLSGIQVGSVAVRASDHSWIARVGPSETTSRRCSADDAEHCDALVAGSPMWVYLWLWGRAPPTSVRFDGDYDKVGQLWALLRLATR